MLLLDQIVVKGNHRQRMVLIVTTSTWVWQEIKLEISGEVKKFE